MILVPRHAALGMLQEPNLPILVAENGTKFESRNRTGAPSFAPFSSGFTTIDGGWSDAIVQPVGSRAYLTSLAWLNDGYQGIEVTWSDDHAVHWATTPVIETPQKPDRPWLASGGSTELYLIFTQTGTGTVWKAQSADAGTTWSPFVPVVASVDRQGALSDVGSPMVTQNGTLLLAYSAGPNAAGSAPTDSLPANKLMLARSVDHGQSFIKTQIHAINGSRAVLGTLAGMSQGGDGSIIVQWTQTDGVFSARSIDDGLTWSEPVQWSNVSRAFGLSAWVVAGSGIDLFWFENGPEGWTPVAAHCPLECSAKEIDRHPLPTQDATNTDYPFVTKTMDGTLFLWTDGKAVYGVTRTLG